MYQIQYKLCNKCKEQKPVYEFGMCKEAYDGMYYSCKTCMKKHRKLTELDLLRKNNLYTDYSSPWKHYFKKKSNKNTS